MADVLRIDGRCCSVVSLLVAAWLIAATPVFAGGWHQSISVPMTLESDSNPTFSPSQSTRLWRARTSPSYTLTGAFGVDEISAGLNFQIEQPSDKNIGQARQDPSIFMNWQRLTTTGGLGLAAKYIEASTRDSELNETGLIVIDGTRKTQSLSGNWRLNLSERSSLSANADFTNVAYSSGTLLGYRNTGVGLSYNYSWSERIEPFVRVTLSHYVPEGSIAASSDNSTLSGGIRVKASENFNWTMQGGSNRTSGSSSVTGRQGSFALNYSGARDTLTLEVSRSSSASGQGGFVESDAIKGSWNYAINARTRFNLDATRLNSKSVVPNTMNQLGASVSQELSPFWRANLSIQHRQRQQSSLPTASSNVLGLSLTYNHPDF